jgi:hypothetical protein
MSKQEPFKMRFQKSMMFELCWLDFNFGNGFRLMGQFPL